MKCVATAQVRKVLGWPNKYKLARAFRWEYSDKRLQLAQLLGNLASFSLGGGSGREGCRAAYMPIESAAGKRFAAGNAKDAQHPPPRAARTEGLDRRGRDAGRCGRGSNHLHHLFGGVRHSGLVGRFSRSIICWKHSLYGAFGRAGI